MTLCSKMPKFESVYLYTGYSVLQLQCKSNADQVKYKIDTVYIYFGLPWFQRFIFIIFIAKGRGKINLWLKAAIDSSSHVNQFELGSDPDSVS